jgi:hypothetical protein
MLSSSLSANPTMRMHRVKFAILGLVYGTVFTAWAAIGSGGGHYTFPLALSTPVGFILWPIVGCLSADLRTRETKSVFLCLMMCDYAFLAFDTYVLFPVVSIFYGVGQLFLWVRFFRTLTMFRVG